MLHLYGWLRVSYSTMRIPALAYSDHFLPDPGVTLGLLPVLKAMRFTSTSHLWLVSNQFRWILVIWLAVSPWIDIPCTLEEALSDTSKPWSIWSFFESLVLSSIVPQYTCQDGYFNFQDGYPYMSKSFLFVTSRSFLFCYVHGSDIQTSDGCPSRPALEFVWPEFYEKSYLVVYLVYNLMYICI